MVDPPTLLDLPPPPSGRTGWPWTMATKRLPATRPDGSGWPRISIVTPSYNQGDYLEETIRSVLLQGYPNLEYIVLDGGSSDASPDIIRKYAPWLSRWRSEPDRGQVPAIIDGLSHSTGAILNWVNSDDALQPNCLQAVGVCDALVEGADIICGTRLLRDGATGIERLQLHWQPHWRLYMLGIPDFPQECAFFSRRAWELAGELDERMRYAFDVAFYARALANSRSLAFSPSVFGVMHEHGSQKTFTHDAYKVEEQRILTAEYSPRGLMPRVWRRALNTRFQPVVRALLDLTVRANGRAKVVYYDNHEGAWRTCEP